MTSARRAAGAPARSKRLFDLVGATLLLIVLSPVVSVVAVLGRLRLGRPRGDVAVNAHPHDTRRIQDVFKRLFDLGVAGALLIVLSPVIAAVAALVRLRLGRPVIYRQERPGRGGRPFKIYKFRTMLNTTDENGMLLPSAQRTSRFGQRIRALSLDELPQLWNVIKGDMSLVGPRPLMPEYLPLYNAEQARRHEVRPGITGLTAVSGRNALTWEEKFALDIEYVDNHDLRMDLDILMRTFATVLSRRGVRHSEQVDMPDFLGSVDQAAVAGGKP